MKPMSDRARRPIQLSLLLDLTFVGGAEILLLNLFRGFDPAVVRPRVLCLREAGDLASAFRDAGIPVDVIGRSGRFDPRTLPRLVSRLRRDHTDVVLVTHHHRASLTLGRIAARLARTKANVIAAHDMDLTSVGGRVLPGYVVNTLFLSDALILLAPSQGDYLRREEGVGRFPWRRIREVVIRNGIEVGPAPTAEDRRGARETLALAPGEVAVGIVARLTDQKAHEVLIQAIARLVPTHPNIRLVVIGDGPRAPELRAEVERLGIGAQVNFLGVRSDVAALLPGLDLACLSSVHEGAPMSVLEAMAAGLPVVTTDCGALRDMVGDGHDGFVVPVGDVDALADRIGTLADDPTLRARFGATARARAERDFRIEGTVAGFQRLLTSLVDR